MTPKCIADRVQLGRLPGRLADRDGLDSELRDIRDLLPALQHGDEPRSGRPARIHHTPDLGARVFLELTSRTNSDYGLDTVSTPQIKLGINYLETNLWGVPANPIHNKHRFVTPLTFLAACFDYENGCPPGSESSETFAKSNIPEKPFLQNPTTCGVELKGHADVEYYEGYEVSDEATYPATTGCQQLSFSPSVLAKPTTDRSDTASGSI